jgi:hypothetical protein
MVPKNPTGMKKKILHLSPVIFCFFLLQSCSNSTTKSYSTGLKVYKEFDHSRKFDTTSDKSAFYFRPVKIDMFYPADEVPVKSSLLYGDIMDMYEQRMNYDLPVDSCRKTSRWLAKMFADYLHLDTASKILRYKTTIFPDLGLPRKKHPLIIYAAGMNGSSWENIILFDSLTKAGYVVAAISSVGLFPGYMSGPNDLDEQVQDILFVKEKMKQLPFVDAENIGLLSWSLGGSAITKAAMLSDDFDCLLSFDGTEIHYYGFDKSWDKDYDSITQIAPFKPASIHVPYMYLSGEHPTKVDSIYNLLSHVSSPDKYFLKFMKATHEDFSSIITIVKTVGPKLGNIDDNRHQIVCGLALTFFDQYLNHKKTTSIAEYIASLMKSHPGKFSTDYPPK